MAFLLEAFFWVVILISGLIGGVIACFVAPLTIPPIQFILVSPIGIVFNIITFGLGGAALVMFLVFNLNIYLLHSLPWGDEAVINIERRVGIQNESDTATLSPSSTEQRKAPVFYDEGSESYDKILDPYLPDATQSKFLPYAKDAVNKILTETQNSRLKSPAITGLAVISADESSGEYTALARLHGYVNNSQELIYISFHGVSQQNGSENTFKIDRVNHVTAVKEVEHSKNH